MSAVKTCPNQKRHTRAPSDYIAWHEWAERKARTHQQVKCPDCGRYAIWEKKPVSDAGGER